MLQQTQVATVVSFYEDFLATYPDVNSLAKAKEQQVLRSWEGLGYYRRARQMHAAAKIIVERHNGSFPDSFDDVYVLPGIGRYTAGAILSFAHNQRLPIVEANTIRLYARLLAITEQVEDRTTEHTLWEFAERILPRKDPGRFNHALMDLGSTICTPREPGCLDCPLNGLCFARLSGNQNSIPVRKPKRKFKQIFESNVLVLRRDKILMRLCGKDEWWTGMWDFPRFRVSRYATPEILRLMNDQTGLQIVIDKPGTTIKHTVTHHNITLDCYIADSVKGRLKVPKKSGDESDAKSKFRWISKSELGDYPLSVTARKIAKKFL